MPNWLSRKNKSGDTSHFQPNKVKRDISDDNLITFAHGLDVDNDSNSFAEEMRDEFNEENLIKKIGQTISWGGFLTGVFAITSFAIGQPWIFAVFQAYKAGDFTYKMAKKLEDEQIDKSIEELVKKGLNVGFQRLSDPKVNEISSRLLYAFCETGLADTVARETALDRSVVDTMFQNSVDGIFDNGIENLVDFTVDII